MLHPVYYHAIIIARSLASLAEHLELDDISTPATTSSGTYHSLAGYAICARRKATTREGCEGNGPWWPTRSRGSLLRSRIR